jgi:hypothetical protein
VLKVCAIAIAIAAAWLFLLKAPFLRWQKALFLVGVFPLYEYSVMTRNYGITMLLLFWFALLYPERFRRPIQMGVVVFLLAQTNAYGLVTGLCLFGANVLELVISGVVRVDRRWQLRLSGRCLVGLGIMLLGFALAIFTIWPDEHSKVRTLGSISFFTKDAWTVSLRTPTRVYYEAFGLDYFETFRTRERLWWIVWALGLWLMFRPYLWLAVTTAFVGMGVFASSVYGASLRHQGVFLMLLIAALWIDKTMPGPAWLTRLYWPKRLKQAVNFIPLALLSLILVAQMHRGYLKITQDREFELSSAKPFSVFLEKHPRYERAILLGDPDYNVESVPYYLPNDLYYVRESRFAHYAHFTRQNRDRITLHELLSSARALRDGYQVPVLLLLSYELRPNGPFDIVFSYGAISYDRETFEDFASSTTKVGSFNKDPLNGENYDVYELN